MYFYRDQIFLSVGQTSDCWTVTLIGRGSIRDVFSAKLDLNIMYSHQAPDLNIDTNRHQISQVNFKARHKISNLTRAEWETLKHIQSRNYIFIKPVDTGGRVVVRRKDLCIKITVKYVFLCQTNNQSFNQAVFNIIKEEIRLGNLPENGNKLYFQYPRTSVFYMLAKIHQPDNPGRPVASAVSCPTLQILAHLDSIFTPVNQQFLTFFKDTSHVLFLLKILNSKA